MSSKKLSVQLQTGSFNFMKLLLVLSTFHLEKGRKTRWFFLFFIGQS